MIEIARRPIAVITGASSGIGEEFARQLASRGYDLVLVARRIEKLEKLAGTLRDVHQVDCVAFKADLSRPEERDSFCDALEADKTRLEILVNNAGFGTHGFFHETDLRRELDLINVNCAAPVHLTKRVLPWMLERHRGFIVNVASLSAFTPGPVMAMGGMPRHWCERPRTLSGPGTNRVSRVRRNLVEGPLERHGAGRGRTCGR
jgi:short-subunit dehydrogenase